MSTESAREWQDRLKLIYPNVGVSPDTMMVHVFTWSGELSRILVRTGGLDGTKPDGPRTNHTVLKAMTWLIAICNRYEFYISDAIGERFPKACPYCLRAPCICDETEKTAYYPGGRAKMPLHEAALELEAMARVYRDNTHSFDKLREIILSVYPGNLSLLRKGRHDVILAKILEEGGELQSAYRQLELSRLSKIKTKTDFLAAVREEVADLSAWLLSCWDISRADTSISSELERMFALGCNTCHKDPCVCTTYHDSFNIEKSIERFRDGMRRAKIVAQGITTPDIQRAEQIVDDATKADTREELLSLVSEAETIENSEVSAFAVGVVERLLLNKRD